MRDQSDGSNGKKVEEKVKEISIENQRNQSRNLLSFLEVVRMTNHHGRTEQQAIIEIGRELAHPRLID